MYVRERWGRGGGGGGGGRVGSGRWWWAGREEVGVIHDARGKDVWPRGFGEGTPCQRRCQRHCQRGDEWRESGGGWCVNEQSGPGGNVRGNLSDAGSG